MEMRCWGVRVASEEEWQWVVTPIIAGVIEVDAERGVQVLEPEQRRLAGAGGKFQHLALLWKRPGLDSWEVMGYGLGLGFFVGVWFGVWVWFRCGAWVGFGFGVGLRVWGLA